MGRIPSSSRQSRERVADSGPPVTSERADTVRSLWVTTREPAGSAQGIPDVHRTPEGSVGIGGADVGSAKRARYDIRRENLRETQFSKDLLVDGVGVQRLPRTLGNSRDRHLFIPFDLENVYQYVSANREWPTWFKNPCEAFFQNYRTEVDRTKPISRKKKFPIEFEADLIFLALPTGRMTEKAPGPVPSWNRWLPKLPSYFAHASNQLLADEGCLAVLHSGDFVHSSTVAAGILATKAFECLGSWTVILEQPIHSEDGLSLLSLRLDVFCRSGVKLTVPVDRDFVPLDVGSRPSSGNILHMGIDYKAARTGSFLGGQRVTAGFMQSVIEMLSAPGDIVLDWRIGEGTSFRAGECSNRFVIGMEARPELKDFARDGLEAVVNKDIMENRMDVDDAWVDDATPGLGLSSGIGEGSQFESPQNDGWMT